MSVRLLLGVLVLTLGAGCANRQFAQVSVESNPPSAEVWIGKEYRDTAPCTLLFEEPADLVLWLKKPGYVSVKKRVTVVERQEGDEEFLEALPKSMVVTLDPIEPEGGDSGSSSGDGAGGDPYYDE